jgi:hypothetical protein
MNDDSPELAAIKFLHKQFQKFAARSLEQGLQIMSLLQVELDLLTIMLKAQGFSQEQIDEFVAARTELAQKYYRENAEALSQFSDALLEADKKPPM